MSHLHLQLGDRVRVRGTPAAGVITAIDRQGFRDVDGNHITMYRVNTGGASPWYDAGSLEPDPEAS